MEPQPKDSAQAARLIAAWVQDQHDEHSKSPYSAEHAIASCVKMQEHHKPRRDITTRFTTQRKERTFLAR